MNDMMIEQSLHGYSNGHHLLVSSCPISDSSQKTMTILSDLSGPGLVNGFDEYVTGYPLPHDNLYAFSKTWYASEMRRPGCVWTHTLLIRFENLQNKIDFSCLLDLFNRPIGAEFDMEKYATPIHVDVRRSFEINIHSKNILKALYWSMFSSDKPIVIPASSSSDYLYEVMCFMRYIPYLYRNFSFCTGSLANRTIEKRTFDLQITSSSLSRNIVRSRSDIVLLDANSINSISDKWIEALLLNSNYIPFSEFVDVFSNKIVYSRSILGKMAELYAYSGLYKYKANIAVYLDFVHNIFEGESKSIIINETIREILENNELQWFGYRNSLLNIIHLMTADLSGINDLLDMNKIKKFTLDFVIDKERIKDLMTQIYDKSINIVGERIIRSMSSMISENMLAYYTNMDIRACIILVTANNRLALSVDNWRQSRNFQLEILDCIDRNNLDDNMAENIIQVILNTTAELLYMQIYKVFGPKAIPVVLKWCFQNEPIRSVKSSWILIGKMNVNTTLEWVFSSSSHDINDLVDVLLTLDSFSESVLSYGKKSWENLFTINNIKQLNNKNRLLVALFLLPILCLTQGKFSNEIAFFIFDNINNSLEKQELDYDSWERIEGILPEVPWYKAWDKCKRLRLAFKERGYPVKTYFFD